jgi:hypothetical protein
MKTLKRRASSGFVSYPKDFEKRVVDGTARFRTRCDMLVGPCSCGGVHQESDGWVEEVLEQYDATIEQLTLAPEDDGRVLIPRYWQKPRDHAHCNVLVGHCACSRTHRASETWVRTFVSQHCAKLVGCEAVEVEAPSDDLFVRASANIDPYSAERARERERQPSRLRRDQI